MARFNIEEQLWTDIIPFAAKLGDYEKAIGHVLRFWKAVRDQHKNGRLLSEEDFKRHVFSEDLFDFFAIRLDDGITARGAGKHWDWLKERVKAAKSGGKSKSEAKTASLKQNRSKTEANRSKSEASYSSSSSKKSNTNTGVCFLGNEEEEAFETWWQAWPNKADRTPAFKAFAKKKPKISDLLTATEKYKNKKPSWQSYCNGATFINSKYQDVLRDDYALEDDTEQRMRSV